MDSRFDLCSLAPEFYACSPFGVKGGSRTAPTGHFGRGQKKRPPIIGATCAFDAKIYKNVDGVFDVSACGGGDKKIFKNCDFCFQLPALLVEK